MSAVDRTSFIIIAPQNDIHALAVKREAELLGVDGIIIDLADIADEPLTIQFSAKQDIVRIGSMSLRCGQLTGVWNRRPATPRSDVVASQVDDARFVARSNEVAFMGGLLSLDTKFINPITSSSIARYKPYQLSLARTLGMKIPETIITSSPTEARDFCKRGGRTIYKTITTWRYGLKETREIEEDDFGELHKLSGCPTIFQELVEGETDIRVTIVGNEIFPADVHFKHGRSKIDGRLDRVPITVAKLQQFEIESILRLHSELGLVYGAYDFRRNSAGELVFFEVNPDGQYLFVEIASGLPISKALANALCGQ